MRVSRWLQFLEGPWGRRGELAQEGYLALVPSLLAGLPVSARPPLVYAEVTVITFKTGSDLVLLLRRL